MCQRSSDNVGGSVGNCWVTAVVENSSFFSLGVLTYVCLRDVMDVVLRRGVVAAHV